MATISTCFAGTATIMTCKKIAQSFSENIYELSSIRSDWTPEYATKLKSRIKNVIEKHFVGGQVCSVHEQRTQLKESMIVALKDISVIRALIKVYFQDDKNFIRDTFSQLGYTDYFSDARDGDHYSLFMLTETFQKELTPELINTFESKGVKQELFHRILKYSNEWDNVKTCFDVTSSSEVSCQLSIQDVATIYSEIKDICRIASAYYMIDSQKRDQFSFLKVSIKLNQVLKA